MWVSARMISVCIFVCLSAPAKDMSVYAYVYIYMCVYISAYLLIYANVRRCAYIAHSWPIRVAYGFRVQCDPWLEGPVSLYQSLTMLGSHTESENYTPIFNILLGFISTKV